MKKHYFFSILTVAALLLGSASISYGQAGLTPDTEVETDKRAQTGMKFLSTSVDARASAIGSALTAEMIGTSTSMFYNPASMGFMVGRMHAAATSMSFIADIGYTQASIAFRPGSGGNFGVVGVSLVSTITFVPTMTMDLCSWAPINPRPWLWAWGTPDPLVTVSRRAPM